MKTNDQWWKKSVVYQIYPRSFKDSNGDGIGDIQGIIEKLDYLKLLGVDVIWLSPIYDSPNDDNGYDIRNYQAIMNEFGTMADFDRMLAELHKREMRLVMDLVVNHTSDEHEWFVQSKKSKDNPYRDYYFWRKGKDGKEPNNWGSVFSGSAWQYDETTNEYFLHLFSKKQPDLNWENPKLREEVYQMMKFWLDKGIDGFRMDVINMISKQADLPDGEQSVGQLYGDGGQYYMNGPRIHEFLQEMNHEVLSNYPIMTVGEMPGATPEDAKKYTDPDRKEVNMIFTFEHMDLDSAPGGKWNLKPLNLVDLKENLTKWQTALHNKGWNSLYWNNHDQPRIVSRFGNDGEYRVESAKMLASCLHFMQGTPYIYQGEEIGMTNVKFESLEDYRDIETINMYNERKALGYPHEEIMASIYVKGRDNARTPMQWDDSEHGGFTSGTPWIKVNPRYKEINVKNALADSESIFYFYQKLIALRKEMDIVIEGDFQLLLKDHPKLFAYERKWSDEVLLVLCNFSEDEVIIEDAELRIKLAEYNVVLANYEAGSQSNLRPYESIVLKNN
ncbi:glycoside hydrolase family 13 protein [Neobacillus vireti]|uniref:oligo-1,6-glucosidase n=1 Tax=Neobacillus vireti LMG 21834 TaxID=1131730 RepID=A0AB94IUW3_9BACI|nr:alpha-glucosidase [Neobacillus vireti]ETI70840.1 Oligo-1,6-glucosidase [Neobacillus vireti LMG 21834]KLT17626.1 oligo-1,6-glucosidase [Neobacillus vireti]